MKKFFIITFIILGILFTLTACGNNEGQAVSDSTRNIQSGESQKTETTNNPKTLDNIYVWIITLIISIIGLSFGVFKAKKMLKN